MGLVALTFDLLTLKLVCESHQKWQTFLPNLGTLGVWVLEFLAMYATDGQRWTDGRTDKSNAYCRLPHGRMHNNYRRCVSPVLLCTAEIDLLQINRPGRRRSEA